MDLKSLLFAAGISFLLSLGLNLFFWLASFHTRRFNSGRVSFLGGVGFSLAALLGFALFIKRSHVYVPRDFITALFFSFVVLFVELLDDLREFGLRRKIFSQAVIVLFYFILGGKIISIFVFPSWLNYLLTFLWLVGITNAFNLLDIADGLCGGVAFLITLGFLFLGLILKSVLIFLFSFFLCLSLLAFLVFNIHPAKIFMGNAGSHFLGFLFATFSINLDYANSTNFYLVVIPLLILAVPIIDTAFLLYVRPQKNILPFKKSDDHIFMRLRKKDFSYHKSIWVFYLGAFAYITSAFILYFWHPVGLVLVSALFILTVFFLKKHAFT